MSGGTPASVKKTEKNTRYILHFFKNKPFARAERERERERKKASDVFDDERESDRVREMYGT